MYLRSDPPWFAFLIHPRDMSDLLRWKGARLLRQYSASDEDFVRKATSMPPVMGGEVLFGFGALRGELVGVMRMPEQMVGLHGRTSVTEAVRFAADRCARVVGLGALTAPVTSAGRALLRTVPDGVTITTGNAYTAAVCRHNVVTAAAALNLGRPARVAVLGATGSVGVPASHLLVKEGFEVTVIGRNLGRVRAALGDLAGEAVFAEGLDDLSHADILVVLTSAAEALLTTAHVAAGAIVIDVTQPANIPERTYAEFASRGIRVVPGGLVRIPGYRTTYDLALGDSAVTFACLAETYLMAREGIRDHSVGPPPVELALRMERIAARHGVTPVPLKLSGDAPTQQPGPVTASTATHPVEEGRQS